MIDNNTRFLGIDSTKVDLTKKKDELNNSVGAYYTLDEMAALPVETTYPVTNAAEAGKKFWYKGNEWHYMTQAQIDSTGWTGLVSVGFPAPVNKILNYVVLNNFVGPFPLPNIMGINAYASDQLGGIWTNVVTEFDALGLGILAPSVETVSFSKQDSAGGISKFRNSNLLVSLKDIGTKKAVDIGSPGPTIDVSAAVLNDFFTQLPITTNTATIRILFCSGALTCDPTIATAKGYTVVV
jgi:hypothetical protein